MGAESSGLLWSAQGSNDPENMWALKPPPNNSKAMGQCWWEEGTGVALRVLGQRQGPPDHRGAPAYLGTKPTFSQAGVDAYKSRTSQICTTHGGPHMGR